MSCKFGLSRKDVVVTDSWGDRDDGTKNCHNLGTPQCNCLLGDSWTCGDRFQPGGNFHHKWEQDTTIEKTSWGFDRTVGLRGYKTLSDLLSELVPTVAFGGNYLINIGPTADGRILPIFEERLIQLGDWLKVHGESIYETRIWPRMQKEAEFPYYYTLKNSTVNAEVALYCIFLEWPEDFSLNLSAPKVENSSKVVLLGNNNVLSFKPGTTGGLEIALPRSILPSSLTSTSGWAVKITNFS